MFSPTETKLRELHPKGSIVAKKTIQNEYVLLSQSTFRMKRHSSGCKDKSGGKFRSVYQTRKWRGARFFNKMIRVGFWTEAK